MAEFPSKVSTRTSSPAQGSGASAWALRPDLGFVRSTVGALMLLQLVLGLLVWALIADTPYHLYPAYGWVMFVAVFLWLVTIVFFIFYLLQLHQKWYTVPWPLVLMVFNASATVLYITAFITCSAVVDLTSLKGSRPYNQRAAASVSVVPGASLAVYRGDGTRPPSSLCPFSQRPGTWHLPSSRHLTCKWASQGAGLLWAPLISSKALGSGDAWGMVCGGQRNIQGACGTLL
uniref:Plasmolipin n=1 Tax=Oryctolagus cuniculus TaxID=9986 RepID=A0A5F9D1X5_RABIT